MFRKFLLGIFAFVTVAHFPSDSISAPLYGITLRSAALDQTGLIDKNFSGQSAFSELLSEGTVTRVIQGQTVVNSLEAFSSANLATGQVRARATCPELEDQCVARAEWFDTLFFDLTDLSGTDFVTVGISIKIDGTFGPDGDPGFSFLAGAQFDALRASGGYRTTLAEDTTDDPETFITNNRAGDFSIFGPDLFVGSVTLQGGDIRELFVALNIFGGTEIDFSNTASFELDSPVSFTSASGVFLSEQQAASIPEPTSLALMLLGLMGMGVGLRRVKMERQL